MSVRHSALIPTSYELLQQAIRAVGLLALSLPDREPCELVPDNRSTGGPIFLRLL
jgi:hypothetical protein